MIEYGTNKCGKINSGTNINMGFYDGKNNF